MEKGVPTQFEKNGENRQEDLEELRRISHLYFVPYTFEVNEQNVTDWNSKLMEESQQFADILRTYSDCTPQEREKLLEYAVTFFERSFNLALLIDKKEGFSFQDQWLYPALNHNPIVEQKIGISPHDPVGRKHFTYHVVNSDTLSHPYPLNKDDIINVWKTALNSDDFIKECSYLQSDALANNPDDRLQGLGVIYAGIRRFTEGTASREELKEIVNRYCVLLDQRLPQFGEIFRFILERCIEDIIHYYRQEREMALEQEPNSELRCSVVVPIHGELFNGNLLPIIENFNNQTVDKNSFELVLLINSNEEDGYKVLQENGLTVQVCQNLADQKVISHDIPDERLVAEMTQYEKEGFVRIQEGGVRIKVVDLASNPLNNVAIDHGVRLQPGIGAIRHEGTRIAVRRLMEAAKDDFHNTLILHMDADGRVPVDCIKDLLKAAKERTEVDTFFLGYDNYFTNLDPKVLDSFYVSQVIHMNRTVRDMIQWGKTRVTTSRICTRPETYVSVGGFRVMGPNEDWQLSGDLIESSKCQFLHQVHVYKNDRYSPNRTGGFDSGDRLIQFKRYKILPPELRLMVADIAKFVTKPNTSKESYTRLTERAGNNREMAEDFSKKLHASLQEQDIPYQEDVFLAMIHNIHTDLKVNAAAPSGYILANRLAEYVEAVLGKKFTIVEEGRQWFEFVQESIKGTAEERQLEFILRKHIKNLNVRIRSRRKLLKNILTHAFAAGVFNKDVFEDFVKNFPTIQQQEAIHNFQVNEIYQRGLLTRSVQAVLESAHDSEEALDILEKNFFPILTELDTQNNPEIYVYAQMSALEEFLEGVLTNPEQFPQTNNFLKEHQLKQSPSA